ncbi:hypothetical protein [Fontivita pretiosa]|uniref:hypothetical protein n=1 Tax=Fontivita pretiosa TaxID=2989684 RepID=UPI003D172159
MLDLTPDAVMQEIRASEELRRRITANTSTLVRRYVGNWYRSDQRSGRPRPENMIFNFVAAMLGDVCFDNPAVAVSAKRSITHKPIARYMQMGINGWIRDVQLRTELELLCLDMFFSFGCALVTLEPRGDYSGTKMGVGGRFNMEALTPAMLRIPPANVIIDSQCDLPAGLGARLLGHMYQRDLTDLQGDERYDQQIVDRLTADDERRIGRYPSEQAFRDSSKSANQNMRGRVTLYDLYFPETRQIGTLALHNDGRAGWIRPLAPYKGPREGPYVLFGVYLVPDQVYPLSPVAAMAEQDQELNAHAAAAAREAATAKNLVLVSADQTELAAQIENAPMNAVLKVKGLNGQNVIPLAIGGTTEQRLAYLNLLLQRTDRNSGQSEAARGRAQGVTATEASLADASRDVRSEFIHLKFRDAVKDALTRVGWYFFNDPAVVAPVSFTDPATGIETEGIFLGGVQPGQQDMDWSQFFLEIEPMSMRRVDPQQQQQTATLVLNTAMTIGPAVLQMPYINWVEILDLLGEAYNIPDFSRLVFNAAGLQLIQEGLIAGPMPGLNAQLPGLLPANAASPMRLAAQGAPVALANLKPQGLNPPGAAAGGASGPTAAGAARFGRPARAAA